MMWVRLLLVFGSLPVAGFAVAQTDVRLPPHGRLPASVDLMPELERLGLTARVQGDRDNCSLFAVTGVAEFEVGRESQRRQPRLSEEFLIWAANEGLGHDRRPGDVLQGGPRPQRAGHLRRRVDALPGHAATPPAGRLRPPWPMPSKRAGAGGCIGSSVGTCNAR